MYVVYGSVVKLAFYFHKQGMGSYQRGIESGSDLKNAHMSFEARVG